MVKSATNEYGLFYANRGTVTGPYQGFLFSSVSSANEARLFFGRESKRKLHVRRSDWTPVSSGLYLTPSTESGRL